MAFNGFSTKEGLFDIIFNSASSISLRDKKHISIWILNVARQFLFLLDLIAESEDDEGIPLFILPVTDNLASLRYHFETLKVDNAFWYRIYQ